MEALCKANALLKQFITIQLVQLNITSNALNSNHSPSRLSRDIPRRATRHHPKCTTPNHLLNVQVASRDFPLSRERWIQVGFITRRLFISSVLLALVLLSLRCFTRHLYIMQASREQQAIKTTAPDMEAYKMTRLLSLSFSIWKVLVSGCVGESGLEVGSVLFSVRGSVTLACCTTKVNASEPTLFFAVHTKRAKSSSPVC